MGEVDTLALDRTLTIEKDIVIARILLIIRWVTDKGNFLLVNFGLVDRIDESVTILVDKASSVLIEIIPLPEYNTIA